MLHIMSIYPIVYVSTRVHARFTRAVNVEQGRISLYRTINLFRRTAKQ